MTDVAVYGSYAYATLELSPNGELGVVVIDIVNPANPHYVGYVRTASEANGIVVSGAHAYVVDNEGLYVSGLFSDLHRPGWHGLVTK